LAGPAARSSPFARPAARNDGRAAAYLLSTTGQQGDDVTAPRQKTFLLARPEARALDWIARRLPVRVMPDHLTFLGVLAAIGIAAAYALSNRDPMWLWAASGLLGVHWLGDSLDGTLARVRRTERPRYGYYLDHLVDAVATALVGIGLGLSPYMLLSTGLVIVIAYLVLSINTYLETQALGVFSLGYGRLGPTEARLGLIAVNVGLALGLAPAVPVLGVGIGVLDVAGLAVAGAMLAALGVRAARNLRELAAREPAAHAAP
jgi:phosphatidylglycerophosphate synthase